MISEPDGEEEELGATPLDGDDADWMRFELEEQEALDAALT